MNHTFFATAPKGLSRLLADELRALGAVNTQPVTAGVSFQGPIGVAYAVCMWSRLANRILLQIAQLEAADEQALYDAALSIDWQDHLNPSRTFAIDYTGRNASFRHSQFCALKIKDAVADYFRKTSGQRPSVQTDQPDVRISAFARGPKVTFYIDLSGTSLHQRGYRATAGQAPMKENLAAAILLSAHWPDIARDGGAFVDPMCGSGTLAIEAALYAADRAPGLNRRWWGFQGWLGHDETAWLPIAQAARERAEQGRQQVPPLFAADQDRDILRIAQDNAKRAGVIDSIEFQQRSLREWPAAPAPFGLLAVNPPYGERLADNHQLTPLYAQLGALIQQQFHAWRYAVFAADTAPSHALGLERPRRNAFFNGALACTLLTGGRRRAPRNEDEAPAKVETPDAALTQIADMLRNRLRKNIKEAERWARKNHVQCYRVYDADMPEFSFAVDLYQGEQRWLHVQEYAPPASVDSHKAALRRQIALQVLPEVFDIPADSVYFKFRKRQRKGEQYEKLAEQKQFFAVAEGMAKFWVNFTDYLDTGLFLDHRPTRAMIGELAKGKRFLNLFAYTGSASVYAALGGAASTTTVDMSTTYLDWAQRNFKLNGLSGQQHRFIQADCLQWLDQARRERESFDLIFLDPPTFSRSKRMDQTFDIQRDHEALIGAAMALLKPAGTLVFSTNAQRFKLAASASENWSVEDISQTTIPWDFRRNPKIHQCWMIKRP